MNQLRIVFALLASAFIITGCNSAPPFEIDTAKRIIVQVGQGDRVNDGDWTSVDSTKPIVAQCLDSMKKASEVAAHNATIETKTAFAQQVKDQGDGLFQAFYVSVNGFLEVAKLRQSSTMPTPADGKGVSVTSSRGYLTLFPEEAEALRVKLRTLQSQLIVLLPLGYKFVCPGLQLNSEDCRWQEQKLAAGLLK